MALRLCTLCLKHLVKIGPYWICRNLACPQLVDPATLPRTTE